MCKFRAETENFDFFGPSLPKNGLFYFFLQNDLHNEWKSEIKYIQQSPNWYFVTKKENVKTIVNKITNQNNLKWKVSIKVKLKWKFRHDFGRGKSKIFVSLKYK